MNWVARTRREPRVEVVHFGAVAPKRARAGGGVFLVVLIVDREDPLASTEIRIVETRLGFAQHVHSAKQNRTHSTLLFLVVGCCLIVLLILLRASDKEIT